MFADSVIGTACTKTISGTDWFHNYLKCLVEKFF